MEGGRSYAAVCKECTCKKKVGAAHDNLQINELRILQHAKLELEQQLKGKKLILKVDTLLQ